MCWGLYELYRDFARLSLIMEDQKEKIMMKLRLDVSEQPKP